MEKLILTDELKKKFRGLLPITSTAQDRWTPKEYSELPEDFRPVFVLAPLDGEAQAALDNTSNAGDRSLTVLKYGLKAIEWKAYPQINGEVTEGKVNMIPTALRWIITNRIWQITNLSDEERRGLDSLPESTQAQ